MIGRRLSQLSGLIMVLHRLRLEVQVAWVSIYQEDIYQSPYWKHISERIELLLKFPVKEYGFF